MHILRRLPLVSSFLVAVPAALGLPAPDDTTPTQARDVSAPDVSAPANVSLAENRLTIRGSGFLQSCWWVALRSDGHTLEACCESGNSSGGPGRLPRLQLDRRPRGHLFLLLRRALAIKFVHGSVSERGGMFASADLVLVGTSTFPCTFLAVDHRRHEEIKSKHRQSLVVFSIIAELQKKLSLDAENLENIRWSIPDVVKRCLALPCMHQPMSTFSPIAPKDADSPIPSVNSIVPKRSKEWGLGKNKKYLKDVAPLGVHPGASGSGGPVASMSPSTSDSQIQDTPNLDSASQLSGDSATSPITPTEPAESIFRDEEGDILSHPSESSDAVDVSGAWERLATLGVLVDIFGKRFQLVDAEGQSTSEVKSLSNTSKPPNDLFANVGTDFADSFVCFPDQEGEHVSDPPTTTAGVFAGDQHDEDTDLERRNDGIDYTYQHPGTGWLNTRNKPHRSFKGGDAARRPPWCDADLPKTKSGIWDTDIPRARFEQGQNLTLQTGVEFLFAFVILKLRET
ncbi:hypothetical protein QBC37DRAFT_458038 [Rhypophila decipiens]|uniref:Uncharacterized protein n=1 Tax=Rhypophila decipiens TaxID=261697 RepID=A0AAN6XW75_9PEZI|nr:hypothetical protein QBC37DRAFT_458038 [Rhypophila decipiens]